MLIRLWKARLSFTIWIDPESKGLFLLFSFATAPQAVTDPFPKKKPDDSYRTHVFCTNDTFQPLRKRQTRRGLCVTYWLHTSVISWGLIRAIHIHETSYIISTCCLYSWRCILWRATHINFSQSVPSIKKLSPPFPSSKNLELMAAESHRGRMILIILK